MSVCLYTKLVWTIFVGRSGGWIGLKSVGSLCNFLD